MPTHPPPRRRGRPVLVAALLALGAAASPASGQSLLFGELAGAVVDERGQPVPAAEIVVREVLGGAERRQRAGRDGRFRFGILTTGRYHVRVEAVGYRPLVHVDVTVRPGDGATLRSRLRVATPPVVVADTVPGGHDAGTAAAWVQERGYAELVGARRLASDLALLRSDADARGVEGLPWSRTELLLDGARAGSAAAAEHPRRALAGAAMPLRGLALGSAGGLGFDVEVGGTGVGVRAITERGSGVPLSRTRLEGGTGGTGGAFSVGGPLAGDTVLAIVGADYQAREYLAAPFDGALRATAEGLADAARTAWGVPLGAYLDDAARTEERIGGFGRLDWLPSERVAMTARLSGNRVVTRDVSALGEPLAEPRASFRSTAIAGAVSVLGRLSARWRYELRLSADVADATVRPGLPLTRFAGSGLSVGGDADAGFSDRRLTPRLVSAFHADLGPHRLKLGAAFATTIIESTQLPQRDGAFVFGDATDLAAGLGAWEGLDPRRTASSFRLDETNLFVQDVWHVRDDLQLTVGARVDAPRLPRSEFGENGALLAATGLSARPGGTDAVRIAPRVSWRWTLGAERQWALEGGAGVFHDLPDPRDVAEALAFSGGAPVRAAVGTLGAWPFPPTASAVGDRVTILGPRFEGPRTHRATMSLTRRLGRWTASLAGTYRHTEFLSRRRELDRGLSAIGTDQHGRPLVGRLVQLGGALAAEPGTGRRFTGFDGIRSLEATGFSEFRAVTVGMERASARGVSVAAHYTFSRTRDDVPSDARTLPPFSSGALGRSWLEGRSDLDVPHRAVIAAEWALGGDRQLVVGGVYRLRSGETFTPLVRRGVDANGDGDATNDPAFIDPALPGMTALLDAHACLRSAAGDFAERNGCRAELVHALDLRLAVRIARLRVGRVDLVLDALDVVPGAAGRVDDALLAIDRTRTLATDPLTGVTTVPYVVNPAFGARLAERSPGVLWRAGLRIVP